MEEIATAIDRLATAVNSVGIAIFCIGILFLFFNKMSGHDKVEIKHPKSTTQNDKHNENK